MYQRKVRHGSAAYSISNGADSQARPSDTSSSASRTHTSTSTIRPSARVTDPDPRDSYTGTEVRTAAHTFDHPKG
ncbi:hypothetical protein Srubr_07100 [Streptomyces rubradiris]|uniref:Uncharacterized protein n=1 Tax=Streptomyces rubradiris TaxID=285531 RepID=A0ABQ3R4V4_STRRR|nr:hypothetical protein GCM10018792_26160 [Streptomyces rubradiris]GHI50864.1 hypothetical protein Srubr_07100 [Streptomyces rubradiris]